MNNDILLQCDICSNMIQDHEGSVQYSGDGRLVHLSCSGLQADYQDSFERIAAWYTLFPRNIRINRQAIVFKPVDAKEMADRLDTVFISTSEYDPPPALGLYTRWLPKIKPAVFLLASCISGGVVFYFAILTGLGPLLAALFAIAAWFVVAFLYAVIKTIWFWGAGHTIYLLVGYDPLVTEQIIVHELAHYAHKRRTLSAVLHNYIDHLLSPFFISYSEGLATWVEQKYCRGLGLSLASAPVHYRNGYRLIRFLEKYLGDRFAWSLLKYV